MADVTITGGSEVEASDTYCTNAEIEEEFGVATVSKAADLTGSMTDPEIQEQIDKQRINAFDYCNARLRGGAYETIPIGVSSRPDIISKAEAMVAYAFLLKKRPIAKDSEDGATSVKTILKDADEILRDIRRGFYMLDVEITRHITQPDASVYGNGCLCASCGCAPCNGSANCCISCYHPNFACSSGCACQCNRCCNYAVYVDV